MRWFYVKHPTTVSRRFAYKHLAKFHFLLVYPTQMLLFHCSLTQQISNITVWHPCAAQRAIQCYSLSLVTYMWMSTVVFWTASSWGYSAGHRLLTDHQGIFPDWTPHPSFLVLNRRNCFKIEALSDALATFQTDLHALISTAEKQDSNTGTVLF